MLTILTGIYQSVYAQTDSIVKPYIYHIVAEGCPLNNNGDIYYSTGFLVANKPFVIASAHAVCGCSLIKCQYYDKVGDYHIKKFEIDSIDFNADIAYLSNNDFKDPLFSKHDGFFLSNSPNIYKRYKNIDTLKFIFSGYDGMNKFPSIFQIELINYWIDKKYNDRFANNNKSFLLEENTENCILTSVFTDSIFYDQIYYCTKDNLVEGASGSPIFFRKNDSVFAVGVVSRILKYQTGSRVLIKRSFLNDYKLKNYSKVKTKLIHKIKSISDLTKDCYTNSTIFYDSKNFYKHTFLSGIYIPIDTLTREVKFRILSLGFIHNLVFYLRHNNVKELNAIYHALSYRGNPTVGASEKTIKSKSFIYLYLQLYLYVFKNHDSSNPEENRSYISIDSCQKEISKLLSSRMTTADYKFYRLILKKNLFLPQDLYQRTLTNNFNDYWKITKNWVQTFDYPKVINFYDSILSIIAYNDPHGDNLLDSLFKYQIANKKEANKIIPSSIVDTGQALVKVVSKNSWNKLGQTIRNEFNKVKDSLAFDHPPPLIRIVEGKYKIQEPDSLDLQFNFISSYENLTGYLKYSGFNLGSYYSEGAETFGKIISLTLNNTSKRFNLDTCAISITILGTADMIPFKSPLRYFDEFGDLDINAFQNIKGLPSSKSFQHIATKLSQLEIETKVFKKLKLISESNTKLAYLRAFQVIFSIENNIDKKIHLIYYPYTTTFTDVSGFDWRRTELYVKIKPLARKGLNKFD